MIGRFLVRRENAMSKDNSDLMRYTEMAMKGLTFDADTE
ncbi:hypothetical protein Nizo1840_0750 [Lactiplantibacillus plantarum]|nr:hypothetical protein SF2A35B_0360 [Lactiplantibacillus plantarum]KZT78851.1 hypothetical protein Nizo1839_2153 [Lactiplantibacillus plantarum]KZT87247.1 hypothetical protein Nizo1840_0750 [Lactiplantibacillus plantarum]KZU16242.1 hypothetical protein Nizo2264_0372 [Lactiplantibacillus plantarum]